MTSEIVSDRFIVFRFCLNASRVFLDYLPVLRVTVLPNVLYE